MLPTDNYAVSAIKKNRKDNVQDFPTPPWATRALIEHVIGPKRVEEEMCWEPAANRGYMSMALQEYFKYVVESDIVDYGRLGGSFDFLSSETYQSTVKPHWVITNPPFNRAQQFIEKAQGIAQDGVAMLVRTSFLEGVMRYQTMYMTNPPDIVAQFSERVPMVLGKCDPKASTATSYAWLIWYIDGHKEANKKTIMMWIPPCRKQLEREGDYGA